MQKYEIWLQLVRQEATIAEAAGQWEIDRSTVMRIRTVAKEGALTALAESRPGVKAAQRDWELEAARADDVRLTVTTVASPMNGAPTPGDEVMDRPNANSYAAGIPLVPQ